MINFPAWQYSPNNNAASEGFCKVESAKENITKETHISETETVHLVNDNITKSCNVRSKHRCQLQNLRTPCAKHVLHNCSLPIQTYMLPGLILFRRWTRVSASIIACWFSFGTASLSGATWVSFVLVGLSFVEDKRAGEMLRLSGIVPGSSSFCETIFDGVFLPGTGLSCPNSSS